MPKQLTRDEAIALYDSGEWEAWTDQQIVEFQLFQDKLAVPFGRFHQAIEAVLGHGVWTHEFADPQHLIDEYHARMASAGVATATVTATVGGDSGGDETEGKE